MVTDLISVIVPIYKVEKYLASCVNSLKEQTYRNLEIILVDDGSPDKSGEMCDAFAEQDNRIVVVHKPNGGLSDARNAGIEVAKGDYLLFLDSDDTLHKETLEILWTNLKENGAEISVCDYRAFYEGTEIDKNLPSQNLEVWDNVQALQQIFNPQYGTQMVISTNKLFQKNLFDGIRFPVGKIHEDEFTTYKLLHRAERIVYTDLKLYYYLQREDSLTGNGKISPQYFHVLDAFDERSSFLEAQGLEELAKISRQQSLNHMIITYLEAMDDPESDRDILRECKERFDHAYKVVGKKNGYSLKEQVKNRLFCFSPKMFKQIHTKIVLSK